jgi:hypothetical protein
MLKSGIVISYLEMCQEEGVNLQRGMNFRLKGTSIILMSLRRGAPYVDRVEDNGKILIYEGHDVSRTRKGPNPKTVDQSQQTPLGRLTQNGLFYKAAEEYKQEKIPAEVVKVYEKIYAGVWVYNGLFKLIDAWLEESRARKVFKFKFAIVSEGTQNLSSSRNDLEQDRLIPSSVKLEVWKRDMGKCILCGKNNNLHFDHVIPYSKGGSSLTAKNIQLLCARHNLSKHDQIQ